MSGCGAALFDTALGTCGLAWSPRGVVAIQLPQSSTTSTRQTLQQRVPRARESGSAPPHAQHAVEGIQRLLDGACEPLSSVVLDLDGVAEFHRRVYAATRAIAPGDTATYGGIAAAVGVPGAARAVGRALGANPVPIVVPCHRVVSADGALGGFSAHGGRITKRRLLEIERLAPALFDLPGQVAPEPE